MDQELYFAKNVEREAPAQISDLVSHFSLNDLFKDPKKKKAGKPMALSFAEIIKREKGSQPVRASVGSDIAQLFTT